jgi:hypothetical protein
MNSVERLIRVWVGEEAKERAKEDWDRFVSAAETSNIPDTFVFAPDYEGQKIERELKRIGSFSTGTFFLRLAERLYERKFANSDEATYAILWGCTIANVKIWKVVNKWVEQEYQEYEDFKLRKNQIGELLRAEVLSCEPEEPISAQLFGEAERLLVEREKQLYLYEAFVDKRKDLAEKSCGIVLIVEDKAKDPPKFRDYLVHNIKTKFGLSATLEDYQKIRAWIETYFSNPQKRARAQHLSKTPSPSFSLSSIT